MIKGKTIQIYLPDGNPRGVKIAEFTSRTVQAVLVPRAQIDFACSRQELRNVGVYFLIADGDGNGVPTVYVGEAEDCVGRLKQHNSGKDWWYTAIVFVSKTASFTKAHVKYLEWHCHQVAKASGRCVVENSVLPTKSHVSEPMEADLLDHFETIRVLTSTLGYPIFERIEKPTPQNLLLCKGKSAEATGEYNDDGVVVFEGSLARLAEVASLEKHVIAMRRDLTEKGILAPAGADALRFVKDYVFKSPSMAAAVVLGRPANGWWDWKFVDGRTLDEVRRKCASDT